MNLKTYINQDRIEYFPFLSKAYIIDWLLRPDEYWVRRYLRALRSEEYFAFVKPNKLLMYYYRRKKNILASRLGFFVTAGTIGPGLKIYHYGHIFIHPHAKIGENFTIHSSCLVGSNGKLPDIPPTIGDNVDIGVNAQVLGGITIADGVKIGAGAIVTKSILEPNVTVVGIPARVIGE